MTTLPYVTAILEAAGLSNFDAVPDDVLELSQWRGSAVHAACQYLDEGTLDWATVQPEHVSYVRAWDNWQRESKFKITAIELRVDNIIFGYEGHQDREGLLPDSDRPVDLDLKTGDIRPSTALQLAGYTMCQPKPFKRRRVAVRLKADGTYRTLEFPQLEPTEPSTRKILGHGLLKDFNTFKAALELMRWKEEYL